MSGENQTTAVITSATTTGVGVAVLPNTNGSLILTILAITMIACGLIVLTSFVATRIFTRFVK